MSQQHQGTISADAHTIIHIQFLPQPNSRTYFDATGLSNALEILCQIFEAKIRQQYPDISEITYHYADLKRFYADEVIELSILIFDLDKQAYVPFNLEWILDQLYNHISGSALPVQQQQQQQQQQQPNTQQQQQSILQQSQKQ